MSFQSPAAHEPGWSDAISRTVALVGIMLALEFLALLVAVVLATLTSRMLGEGLQLYPWHVIIAVDFLFIVFSALLAEHAAGEQDATHATSLSPRSMGMASFVISAGTLAPVATHAASVWRFLTNGTEYQHSFLSKLLCRHDSASCHHTYFYIIVLIAVASVTVAFCAARVLRAMAEEDSTLGEEWEIRSAAPLISSVFIFSVYTLFNQPWDVESSQLLEVGRPALIALCAMLLIAAICLCYLAIKLAMAVGRVVSNARRWAHRANPLRAVISVLVACLVWAVIGILLFVLGREAATHVPPPDWLAVGAGFTTALQAAGYFMFFWVLTVAVCAVGAILVAAGWGWRRRNEITDRLVEELQVRADKWTDKASAFVALLQRIPPDMLEQAKTGIDRFRRRRARWSDIHNLTRWPDTETRAVSLGFGEVPSRGPWAPRPKSAAEQVGGESGQGAGDEFRYQQGVRGGEGNGEGGSGDIVRPQVPAVTIWGRVASCADFLVRCTKLLGERIYPAGAVLRVCLAMLMLQPVAPRWIDDPSPPPPSVIEAAPAPPAVHPEKPVPPEEPAPPAPAAKPPTVDQATIECTHHDVLAWSYADVDELYFPVSSCRFREGALAFCKGGAIVVIGRSSYGSDPQAEVRRALERGQTLAGILRTDYIRQCGSQSDTNWYVLNLGPYVGTALKRRAARQREVSVLMLEGPADLDRTVDALQRHIGAQTALGDYMTCDLHAAKRTSAAKSFLRRLDCAVAKRR